MGAGRESESEADGSTAASRFWLSERGKPVRALFCGARDWDNWGEIEQQLLRFIQYQDTIITGGAPGADAIAHKMADDMGFATLVFPAQWDKHGKAAGPIRNQQMLDEGKPDIVLAFHKDLTQSKGTLDMVRRARKAGVRVIWIKDSGMATR